MKRLLSFLAALMLMGATPLAASATAKAEMTIIKSEQFTSTDKNEVYDFEEGFTQNGYEYHLISNTTSIIKTDDNAKVQTKQQEVVTSDLSEKSYDFDDTIETEWGGKKYTAKLVSTYYTQSSIEQKQIYAEGSTSFPHQTSEPIFPNKDYFDVDNDYTGGTQRVQLSLQSVDKTEEEWSDDVSFPIEFSSYSASYYDFNGVRLNHDDKNCPLDGRGDLVLEFLGLDKSKYKITSVKWAGEVNKSNDTRKAVAYGKRLTSTYTAHYADWVTITGGATWIGHGVYEYEISSEGKPVYTIQATGVYQRGTQITQTTTTTTTAMVESKVEETSSVMERAKSAKISKVPVAVEIGGTTGFVAIIVCLGFVNINSIVVYDMKGNRLFSRKCKRSVDLTKAYAEKHERVQIVLKSGAKKKVKGYGGLVFTANGRQLQIVEKTENGYIVKLRYVGDN